MAKTFTQRLQWCIKHGDMTIADVHHWFERPRATVRTWVLDGREARTTPSNYIEKRLADLEEKIRARKGFPIPASLSPGKRPEYVRGLRSGNRTRVSPTHSA